MTEEKGKGVLLYTHSATGDLWIGLVPLLSRAAKPILEGFRALTQEEVRSLGFGNEAADLVVHLIEFSSLRQRERGIYELPLEPDGVQVWFMPHSRIEGYTLDPLSRRAISKLLTMLFPSK